MGRQKREFSFNWQNFWKIIFIFLVILIVTGAVLGVGFWNSSRRPSPESLNEQLQKTGNLLVQKIESDWVFCWNGKLQALSDSLNRLPSQEWESVIERWHLENSDIFSITVRSVELRWPIHHIDSDFWDFPEVQNLAGTSRQMLFDYLLQRPDEIFPPYKQTLWISSILSPQILGYPIATLHYKQENDTKNFSLLIRFPHFRQYLDTLAVPSVEYALINLAGDTLYQSSRFDPNIPEYLAPNRPISDLSKSVDFKILPWRLIVQKTEEFAPVGPEHPLILLGAGMVILLLFLFTGLLTRWIDRPMKPLFDAAVQISRGNFSIRVPEVPNESSNRIGRIINYMAEEMDHIQQMNVSRIIVEKNKTETILRNIGDGVIVTDNTDRILIVNPIAEHWFDIREKQVLNDPASDHIRAKLLLTLIKDVRVSQNDASIDFHMRVIETDEQKVFHAHASPVTGEEDRRIGVVVIIRDVTEQREIERMKTELVSMVAHELKSPLTSICGFSELLLNTHLENPKAQEYAHVILEESNRLTDLVNKFLDLSRLESGRTEPNIQPFDLRQSIGRILEAHGQLAKKKQIRVITELPGHLSAAMGDASMIDQVLLNLFSNAIKYSPVGTKVGIEVKEEELQLIVNVIDNGSGIPKEELPNIFEKFYRVKQTEDTDRPEGSGLGLSLVKQIIERHDGVVRVKSQPGIGSIFSFTIPKQVS